MALLSPLSLSLVTSSPSASPLDGKKRDTIATNDDCVRGIIENLCLSLESHHAEPGTFEAYLHCCFLTRTWMLEGLRLVGSITCILGQRTLLRIVRHLADGAQTLQDAIC